MLPALKAAHDIGAHTAESNHAKLHSYISLRAPPPPLLRREYPIRHFGTPAYPQPEIYDPSWPLGSDSRLETFQLSD